MTETERLKNWWGADIEDRGGRRNDLGCEDSEKFGKWDLEPGRGLDSRQKGTCSSVAEAKKRGEDGSW